MLHDHGPLGEPLGARRAHVVLRQHVEHARAGEADDEPDQEHAERDRRQHEVRGPPIPDAGSQRRFTANTTISIEPEPEHRHGLAEQRQRHRAVVPEPEPLHRREHADRHAEATREAERARRQQQRRRQPLEHHLERRALRADRHAEIAAHGAARGTRAYCVTSGSSRPSARRSAHLLGRGVLAEHELAGSPGVRCSSPKTTTVTSHTSSSDWALRRTTKPSILALTLPLRDCTTPRWRRGCVGKACSPRPLEAALAERGEAGARTESRSPRTPYHGMRYWQLRGRVTLLSRNRETSHGSCAGTGSGGHGAAKGIGRAIAERLAEEGARLALGDIDAAELKRTADGIAAKGGQVITRGGRRHRGRPGRRAHRRRRRALRTPRHPRQQRRRQPEREDLGDEGRGLGLRPAPEPAQRRSSARAPPCRT